MKLDVKALCLPVTIETGVETAAEFDIKAGKDGACLLAACYNEYYRGTAPDVREAVGNIIVEATGIPRRETPTDKLDDRGEPIIVTESWDDYARRIRVVELNLDDAAYVARFKPLIDQKTFVLDLSPTKRGTGKAKTPTKFALEQATSVVDKGAWAKASARIKEQSGYEVPAQTGDREKDIAVMAAAIAHNERDRSYTS